MIIHKEKIRCDEFDGSSKIKYKWQVFTSHSLDWFAFLGNIVMTVFFLSILVAILNISIVIKLIISLSMFLVFVYDNYFKKRNIKEFYTIEEAFVYQQWLINKFEKDVER